MRTFRGPTRLLRRVIITFNTRFQRQNSRSALLAIRSKRHHVSSPRRRIRQRLLTKFPQFTRLTNSVTSNSLRNISMVHRNNRRVIRAILRVRSTTRHSSRISRHRRRRRPTRPISNKRQRPINSAYGLQLSRQHSRRTTRTRRRHPRRTSTPIGVRFMIKMIPPTNVGRHLRSPKYSMFRCTNASRQGRRRRRKVIRLSRRRSNTSHTHAMGQTRQAIRRSTIS